MQITETLQRIPYVPGTTSNRVELHSGLSRYYPELHGNLVARSDATRGVGLILIHPCSNFLSHFLLRPLAAMGLPVMGMNTRYAGNEAALIMENAAGDLGAGVRWMREQLNFEHVIVIGFSGGGSLVSFYQSQAENPTLTVTPAGDPITFSPELTPPADAILLVGAHIGRAAVLQNWIDPSVIDEVDPYATDAALDLFSDARTFPLDREWIDKYRQAQTSRMSGITEWALTELQRAKSMHAADRAFVVHRTVADPRFLDLTIDPSDRAIGSMYGDPKVANMAAGGLARFTTARSWLSTWSVDHTNVYAPRNLAHVHAPVAVLCLMADQAAFVSESRMMRDAVPGGKATLIELRQLNHYLVGQPGAVDLVVREVRDWLAERFAV